MLAELDGRLRVTAPDAGFYLWPQLDGSDTAFARRLFETEHVTVLPGSFLARDARGINPGANRLRMALVAEHEQCVVAARRIVRCLQTL